MLKKNVLVGGPGSGKTSVINLLEKRGHFCMPEISRSIIKNAQKQGIDQLFLNNPLLFSEQLLKERTKQFKTAENYKVKNIFFDRGIPEVVAYLKYAKINYPSHFDESCTKFRYTNVFFFPPWKTIYTDDNERYESFNQAVEISKYVANTYQKLNYKLITVPFASVDERCDFILKTIN